MLKPFYAVGVLLAVSFNAWGQDEETESPAAPPQPPAIVAATQPPRAPVVPQQGGGDLVTVQYPNSDVADVLRFYETLTGKRMIMDNFVQGKVNIFIQKKIPRDEAIQIIEMSLLMNGFSLVPADNDVVKVIGTGRNPRAAGVPVISDESEVPSGEHVVSFLFKLRYADPQELQQVLVQYLSPPQSYTSFLALPKSGSLLVTESTAVIRKLVKIIDQVDIPPAEVVSEFIKLERADASKVVDLLKEVFEKGTQPSGVQPQPGVGVRGVRAQPQPQPAQVESDVGALTALTEEAVVVGKIKITADVRTNRIHVVTRPINIPFVRKLIAEFDANVEFAKPVTRALRYISAGDVLPVLVQALTEPGTEGGGAGPAGAGGLNPQQQQQQQQQQQRRNQSTTNNQYPGGTSSDNSGGSLNISEELSTNAVDTTPKAVTIGNAKIIADQRANAIIVLGNREVVVKVQKILDEMDVSAPQVALSTVIGEFTLNNDEESGFDYFAKYKNKVVGFSRNTGAPLPGGTPTSSASPSGSVGPGIIDPAGLVNFSQIFQAVANGATGTNVYVAAGNYLSAVVHLLESTGRFRVISRPMVFTSNNKKAIIASGTEIPVPVSTLSSVVNGGINSTNVGQQSNIQFKKVALQLEVVPLINSEKEVSLDILQKLDSVSGSTTVDGNQIPNIATRYIRTTVSAPNRATIVLGGLITDSKQKNFNGIPLIDRIPLLGYLFRSTSINKQRSELIILMRPEVTLTKLDLYRLRRTTQEKMAIDKELDKQPPLNQGPDDEEYQSSEKELPPPDLPPIRGNKGK